MTREQLKENWHIIEAFKNGADIQFLDYAGEWRDADKPLFRIDVKYRVKPKQEYIPFDYSDAEYLIGKVVKSKDNKEISMIISFDLDNSDLLQITLGSSFISFYDLFQDYTFLDGSPCGKLKQ